jgi:hypothetical protein
VNAVIVDANLLCLIVAGTFVPSAIGKHKRLKAYGIDDFKKVMEIASFFETAVTCPNILTETSNLLSNTNEQERGLLLDGLRTLLESTLERHTPSFMACQSPYFQKLGLTDAVLLTAEMEGAVLLTVDLDLVLAAQVVGRKVINYNWVRDDPINYQHFGL